MERKTTIATVAAAAGILVAGSAAGIAVVNAAASGVTPTVDDTVVVAGTAPLNAAVAPVAGLPAVPVLSDAPVAAAQATADSAPSAESPSAAPLLITKEQATAAVIAATGGTVQSVSSGNHSGVASFAVTVARTDGSVVTGYVDKGSGVVFDWTVEKAAPKATYTDDDDHEHEEEEHEHEEEEHDEDHEEGDDDD